MSSCSRAATLLCVQSKCPIYVSKRVWDDHSVRLRDLEPGAAKHTRAEEQLLAADTLSGTAALTTLRHGSQSSLSPHSLLCKVMLLGCTVHADVAI